MKVALASGRDDAKLLRKDGANAMQAMQWEAIPRLTYKDLQSFPDDGLRHELIDGVHFVTPAPVTKHQRVSLRLSAAFYNYFELRPIGEAFAAPLDIVLSNFDVVEPDVFVVLNEQRHIIKEKNVAGAPAIVVEILSPSTRRRDEGIKRVLYERTGVREYWIIDPRAESIAVWSRSAEGRLVRTELMHRSEGHRLTTTLLPHFAVPLDKLFQ